MSQFWVGFERLGLGFQRERRERRRKKEKHLRKMRGTGLVLPYIERWNRVGWLDPAPHALNRWILILVDPDQSNAPEAFWRSGSICVFGFGLFTRGLWLFFQFLEFSCYIHLYLCYLNLPMCLVFFVKF